jgi:3-deoxy-D-manno-octulosonic-acid transferase
MMSFMRMFYSFFIYAYTCCIGVAALFNDKAALWISGRKDWKMKLKQIDTSGLPVYWFHCASLGEFEQARPLLEKIKMEHTCKIVLTFFSPSGFEIRKNYASADVVMYLPADTISNASYFIAHLKPKAAFFIKYEFWFNFLWVLRQNQIPVFLVSGIFRESQHFFKWYGKWFANQLAAFDYFFVQNDKSMQLLKRLQYNNVTIAGDTRFDRVVEVMNKHKTYELVDVFTSNSLVCVAGSTYLEDEQLLKVLMEAAQQSNMHHNFKLIIAPHHVTAERLDEIEKNFEQYQCVRYSALLEQDQTKQVLLIDNIGMLSSLYAYADFAYIGGGFGKGIHNTLEAAVFGIPVLIGKNYHKFDEAKALISEKAAFIIEDEKDVIETGMRLLSDEELRAFAGDRAGNYVAKNKGAVYNIMKQLNECTVIFKTA